MSELDRHLDEVLVGGQRPVVVELSEYDRSWPEQFARHRERIVAALGEVEVERATGCGPTPMRAGGTRT